MRGQVSVVGAESAQAFPDHPEMLRFFEGHLHPAVKERVGDPLAGKAGDDVECEIDRVELDMGNRMKQGYAPLERIQ